MQKNLLLLSLTILVSVSLSAQFGTANQKIIGGNFSASAGRSTGTFLLNSPERSQASLGFSYGKFTKKNVLSSVNLSYFFSNIQSQNGITQNANNATGFNLGYRQTYYKEIARKVFAGIGVGGNLGYSNYKQTNPGVNNTNTNQYSVSIDLLPSLSYQINSRFMVNVNASNFAGINYSHSINYINSVNSGKDNFISLGAGFFSNPFNNLSFGFSYLLKN